MSSDFYQIPQKPNQLTDPNSGVDGGAIHKATAAEISAIAAKATPVGADLLLIEDSAVGNVKKSITITSLLALVPSGSLVGAQVTAPLTNGGIVTFNTTVYDTTAFFAGGSPTRLTVPVGKAGYYLVSGFARWDTAAGNGRLLFLRINLNGSVWRHGPQFADTTASLITVSNVSDIVHLAAGDFLTVFTNSPNDQSGIAILTATFIGS